MDPLLDDQTAVPEAPRKKERRREERPKNNPKEDLGYRIKGLEQAKLEPGMSPQDLAALDRIIATLQEKLAAQTAPKL